MMVGASLLGAAFTTGGIILAYYFNLTAGAMIIMLAGVSYLAIDLTLKLYRRSVATV